MAEDEVQIVSPPNATLCDIGGDAAWITTSVTLILYSILSLVTIVGNALVLKVTWRFYRNKPQKRKNLTWYFVSFLAVGDLFVGLGFPLVIVNFYVPAFDDSHVTEALCIGGTFATVAVFSISWIALLPLTVDRYVCILRPQRYTQIVTLKRAILATAVCCVYALGLNVYNVANLEYRRPRKICILEDMMKQGPFIALIVNVSFVFALIAVCNAHIFYLAHKINRNVHSVRSSIGCKRINKQTMHSVKTFLCLTGSYLASYVTYVVVTVNLDPCSGSVAMVVAWRFFELVVPMNSVLNPFVYSFRNRHFKRLALDEIRKALDCIPCIGCLCRRESMSRTEVVNLTVRPLIRTIGIKPDATSTPE